MNGHMRKRSKANEIPFNVDEKIISIKSKFNSKHTKNWLLGVFILAICFLLCAIKLGG